MEGRGREKKISQPVTHRPGSWPCAGRRMDSEIGVARNWSEDSAARRLKVSAKSRDSWRTTWMSMCSGWRNSSSLEDLLDAAAILLACFFGFRCRRRSSLSGSSTIGREEDLATAASVHDHPSRGPAPLPADFQWQQPSQGINQNDVCPCWSIACPRLAHTHARRHATSYKYRMRGVVTCSGSANVDGEIVVDSGTAQSPSETGDR